MQAMNAHLLKSTIDIVSGPEFRTPMNAIYGFANLMYEDAESISVNERREFSMQILKSAERLMNISERIARWYWLKNNSERTDGSCCLTNEFILEMVKEEALRYLNEQEAFIYESRVLQLHVKCECKIIVPVLRELFNNAFKFSADKTLPSVLLREEKGKYHLHINNFSDKASSADLKTYTVFTQFKRNLHEQQGLGLGLEIANLGIQKCGGSLVINEDEDSQNAPFKKISIEVILPVDNACRCK